jgi:hypothetical protein
MSYPTLFTPRAATPGDDPKYGVNILIPKGDPQIAQIQAAIQAEITAGLQGKQPSADPICLKDCMVQYPDNPQQVGYMELRCSSGASNKPHVVDINRQPVIDPSQVYGGAEGWFSVAVSAYSTPQKGITTYVNGVMLTGQEGALGRLDNKQSADAMFANVGAGAAPGAPMTAPPVAPMTAPPVAPPAAPMAPPAAPPAPPAAPVHQMTPKAAGTTYEQFIAAGWTDELLVQHGMMLPPGGVTLPWQQ